MGVAHDSGEAGDPVGTCDVDDAGSVDHVGAFGDAVAPDDIDEADDAAAPASSCHVAASSAHCAYSMRGRR